MAEKAKEKQNSETERMISDLQGCAQEKQVTLRIIQYSDCTLD